MMKKLLALVMVLGIASLATAGIDLGTIDGLSYEVAGNTITVSGQGVTGYLLTLESNDGSALSNSFVPSGFTTFNYAGYNAGSVNHGAGAANTAPVNGVIYSIDFTPGAAELNFIYSSIFADVSSISIGGQAIDLSGYSLIVPEPMTMGLLGLGGLFLARRKK
jgi:hypothetical protein